jgi:hypothetical protein
LRGHHVCRFSDIIATRDIQPGEEVLITYFNPIGQSATRRKLAFEEQHIWNLPKDPFSPLFDQLAASCPSIGQTGFEEAMGAVRELEDELDDIAISVQVCFMSAFP